MKVIAREQRGELVIKDIICDCCGQSCATPHGDFEFASLNAHWGYYSGRDLERWDCDLCEGCSVKVKDFIESLGGKVRVLEELPWPDQGSEELLAEWG